MKDKIIMITPFPKSHRTAEETLGTKYLTSVLRSVGYEVVIINAWLQELSCSDTVELICNEQPFSVVCFSCYRSNLEQAAEILERLKEKFGEIISICGGYGPTFHDEDFLHAGFTIVVRGEAEHIIASLIEATIKQGDLSTIPGISFTDKSGLVRTDGVRPIETLDSLPFPARDNVGVTMDRHNPVHICTSRGCNGHCKYCSVASFARMTPGKFWRGRSIENIVDELRFLYEVFGVTYLKIVDDSFIEPPRDERWTYEFSNRIRHYELPIHFRTQVRADRLSLCIVRNLKTAGWFATSIGIENGSPAALKRMGKTASLKDNKHALTWLHDNDLYVQMGMILFDDATTVPELEANYQFLRDNDWLIIKGIFTEMYAAAGVPFTKELANKNLLRDDSSNQNYWLRLG